MLHKHNRYDANMDLVKYGTISYVRIYIVKVYSLLRKLYSYSFVVEAYSQWVIKIYNEYCDTIRKSIELTIAYVSEIACIL